MDFLGGSVLFITTKARLKLILFSLAYCYETLHYPSYIICVLSKAGYYEGDAFVAFALRESIADP